MTSRIQAKYGQPKQIKTALFLIIFIILFMFPVKSQAANLVDLKWQDQLLIITSNTDSTISVGFWDPDDVFIGQEFAPDLNENYIDMKNDYFASNINQEEEIINVQVHSGILTDITTATIPLEKYNLIQDNRIGLDTETMNVAQNKAILLAVGLLIGSNIMIFLWGFFRRVGE